MKRIMSGHRQVFERKQKEQSVWANPDDPENQAYIQEQVRLQNVQANMETAMEELPEGFQKSEYVEKTGFVDLIVERKDLSEKIGTLLSILLKRNSDISTDENETTEDTQSLSKVAS